MVNWELLVVLSLSLQTTLASECCPSLWTQFGEECYRFIGNPQIWSVAEHQCANLASAVGKEGHLVSIHTTEENDFVHRLWKSSLTPSETGGEPVTRSNSLWLGITDQGNNGVFIWSDRSNTSFTFWRENEPNGGLEEDCGHMWTYGSVDSNWNDARCDIRLPFVCKLDPTSTVVRVQQGKCVTTFYACSPFKNVILYFQHFNSF